MALTKGERTTITTASSVANRMGVVPAYGGNPITTIAEVATEKLDFLLKDKQHYKKVNTKLI
tara:strand:- start:317 stop:502 length:186 start_codon:yes stop_codon:yes gene_type:complete